jgi:hypothetical protein
MMAIHRGKKGTSVRGIILAAMVLVTVCSGAPCFADGFGSLFLPAGTMRAIESVFGPIFPANGIATTFRSELGTGIASGSTISATFTGPDGVARDLRGVSFLESNPFVYDLYANLRLWRFALRGTFTNFEDVSQKIDFAKVDLTGFWLRGQFDAVQLCWLSAGVMGDVYFTEPRFQGTVFENTGGLLTPKFTDLDIKGDRPTTYGVYLRYVPPEILNFPMHFEAFGRRPWSGSKIKSWGFAFVFRPQIYRFDLAARVLFEKTYMQFENSNPPIAPNGVPQKWDVDMGWNLYGIEAAVYF